MSAVNILRTRFFIKKDKAKNNVAPIFTRITLEGKPADISLRREIEIEKWDTDAGRAKDNRGAGREVNDFLDQVRAELTHAFSELKYQRKPLTAEAVKNLFLGIVPQGHTLVGLMDYHNNHLKHTLEWGTMKNYMTTQNYIKLFLQSKFNRKDIPLADLSYTFLVDLQIFLLNYQPKTHHKPCGHNTILKHIERLKKMVNVAIKNEWIEKDPFSKFQGRFIRNDRQSLNPEELAVIEHKTFKTPRLEWARDLFVFSCYTGLAYCDVMSLKPDNITLASTAASGS